VGEWGVVYNCIKQTVGRHFDIEYTSKYMDKKIAGKLEALRIRARNQKCKCFFPKCENNAIRSHIQQKEGTIRGIANEGHVYHVTTSAYFEKSRYKFEKVGIGIQSDTLTFWGFCPTHDSSIFRPIEQANTSFLSYRNQLLFAYRGLSTELYKMIYNLKHYSLIFKSSDLNSSTKDSFKELDLMYKLLIKLLEIVKEKIESELFPKSLGEKFRCLLKFRKFKFIVRHVRRIEICSTAYFVMPKKIKCKVIDDKLFPVSNNQTASLFFNLIPTEFDTVMIFGIEENIADLEAVKLFRRMQTAIQNDLEFEISRILLVFIETWFVSIPLFEKWHKSGKGKEIIYLLDKYSQGNPMKKYDEIKYNIFD
jgi:hypothetical protein